MGMTATPDSRALDPFSTLDSRALSLDARPKSCEPGRQTL